MTSDTARARLIGAMKLALPLAALALLSTLFLFARTVNPEGALPIATVNLSERARDEQLTLPRIRANRAGARPMIWPPALRGPTPPTRAA